MQHKVKMYELTALCAIVQLNGKTIFNAMCGHVIKTSISIKNNSCSLCC